MKRFVLASAVLCLVEAIGTASAATIITSDNVTIWNAATPGATSSSISQQGLPTAVGLFGGPLPLVAARTDFAFPINYNDTAGNTIPGFFASDNPPAPTPATCTSTACLTNPLSAGDFAQATVFRFTFTETTSEIFSVIHDDGVSLFVAGTETTTCTIASCPGDLLPTSAAAPTTANTHSVLIGPGTYDLWYAEVNGLPAVLMATSSAVPEPSAWVMMLLGFAGLGFAFRQSRRRMSFA
jgi:PEP-CTERM motif